MPSTLMDIMSRDPNDCAKADIEEIVKIYRAKRVQFNLGDLKAGSSKPPTAKQAEVNEATKNLKLGDML